MMKRYCLKLLFIFILLSAITCRINAQMGIPDKGDKLIEFFPPSMYKGDIQAWSARGGSNGYVFFASGEGLSVYDGVRWFSPQSYGNKPYDLRSLYFDNETNILYCAGDNEFGFWKTDQFGQFVYTRLFFNEKADNPKMFWRIGRVGKFIYFGAKEAVFRYDLETKGTEHMNANTAFHFMYIADNQVYVQEKNTLYLLENMKKKAIPHSFDDRITAIFKDSITHDLLLFREDRGIFALSTNGSLTELNKETNRLIGKNRLFSVAQAPDGTYLIGTILGGLFKIDRNGNILRNINKKNGLPFVSVLDVTTDSNGNIWMGLEGGVAKMNNIPYESYIVDYNLDIGGVYAVCDDAGKLYFGTNKGVFIHDKDNNYTLLPKTQGQTWNFCKLDDELLVCHDAGVFRINGMSTEQIYSGEGVWSIMKIPFKTDYYIGFTYHGFNLFHRVNGKITDARPINDYMGEARVAAFDKYDYMWVMTTGVGFYRFTFSKDLQSVEYKLYKVPDMAGLPLVFKVDNELIFYSGNRTYHYDSIKDSLVFDQYAQSMIKQCGTGLSYFHQFDNVFWYITNEGVGYIERDHNQFKINSELFSGAYDNRVPWVFQKITRLADGSFAFGLQNRIGIYQYDPHAEIPEIKAPQFSSIEIYDRETLSFGVLNAKEINLSHAYRNVLIYLSGLTQNKLIEYKLEGVSDNWILVKLNESFELPHLSPGKYTLTIRNYGQENDIYTHITIRVYSPWYFTPVAIACYILVLGLIFMMIHLNYKRKTRRILMEEKQRQKLQIESFEREKLEMDLKERDKKLASFMMNELNKNNLLSGIRSLLQEYTQDDNKKENIRLSIGNIDKQLNNQEDWKAFLKYFNNIHDGFFDKLTKQFPHLTMTDLKLCAYLKLNLNTKEMATLLNISPASVDTARHRLRKKLDLDNSENLNQFMSKI